MLAGAMIEQTQQGDGGAMNPLKPAVNCGES